jgi:hypothetical protein
MAAMRAGDGTRLISRNGIQHTKRFSELVQALDSLSADAFLLAGEERGSASDLPDCSLLNVPDRQQVNTLREAGAKVGVAVISARTLYPPSRHLIHVHGPTGGALLPGTAWDALWHGVLTFPFAPRGSMVSGRHELCRLLER